MSRLFVHYIDIQPFFIKTIILATWKLKQTSWIKGTVLYKSSLTLDTSHKSGSPQANLTYGQQATSSEVPTIPLVLIIL